MKKTLILLVLIALALSSLAAQEELPSPAKLFPNSVGISGSATTIGGMGGLSYQRWFGDFGYSLTLGAMAQPVYEVVGSTAASSPSFYAYSYNGELDLLWKLYSSDFWRWLSGDLYTYAKLQHQGGVQSIYTPNADITKPATYVASPFGLTFAAGLGIGYEIILFQHFSIPLQFGYTAQYPFTLGFDTGGGLRYRY